MVKSGIDKMLDSINNRDNDDPMGLKNKKKDMIEKNPTQKTGSGIDGILDNIKNRDDDDPTGSKKSKKKEDKPESKKKRGGGFDGIIDSITERDADDPTGQKPKKKETADKTPLDGVTKSTTDIVTAGVGAMVGIGVLSAMGGMLNQK
jgi:hypothetical protein